MVRSPSSSHIRDYVLFFVIASLNPYFVQVQNETAENMSLVSRDQNRFPRSSGQSDELSALNTSTPAVLHPDSGMRRFEIGGSASDIRTLCVGERNCGVPSAGLGAAGAVNLNRHFAIDGSFNWTANSRTPTNIYGGRESEFLLGVRAEARARHYGYFLKAKPGFLSWSHVITQTIYPTPTTFSFIYGRRTELASAVGGGFEYSPTARIHLRVELNDLLLHYSSGLWTNNLQPVFGVYAGLGKVIPWMPPVYEAKTSHPFLGRENLVLITGSALAITADAITTQRFIVRGQEEGDPFARPFVKYGWSGQISVEVLEIGAELAGMYGLHRIDHHWIERLVPICIASTHGIFAYQNTKLRSNNGTPTP
jgi:hypothetical protein